VCACVCVFMCVLPPFVPPLSSQKKIYYIYICIYICIYMYVMYKYTHPPSHPPTHPPIEARRPFCTRGGTDVLPHNLCLKIQLPALRLVRQSPRNRLDAPCGRVFRGRWMSSTFFFGVFMWVCIICCVCVSYALYVVSVCRMHYMLCLCVMSKN
jgi:hypothetical protein